MLCLQVTVLLLGSRRMCYSSPDVWGSPFSLPSAPKGEEYQNSLENNICCKAEHKPSRLSLLSLTVANSRCLRKSKDYSFITFYLFCHFASLMVRLRAGTYQDHNLAPTIKFSILIHRKSVRNSKQDIRRRAGTSISCAFGRMRFFHKAGFDDP